MKGDIIMKKVLVSILSLVLASLLFASVAVGEDIYIFFIDGEFCAVDEAEEGTTKWIGDIAPNYKDYLLQRNFPASVIQDVSDLCNQYYGTPVGWLGLVSDKGINLRKAPNLGDSYKIATLQEGTTVYVYFKFTDINNKEWYYATTSSGTAGFLRSNFLKLFPYTGS